MITKEKFDELKELIGKEVSSLKEISSLSKNNLTNTDQNERRLISNQINSLRKYLNKSSEKCT